MEVRGPEGEEGSTRSQYAFQEGIEGRGRGLGDGLDKSDGIGGEGVGGLFTGETGWGAGAGE